MKNDTLKHIAALCLIPIFLSIAASAQATDTIQVQDNRSSVNEFQERDNIFMLLAYSVVYKDWQNGDMANNRGYNIGSVLVDKNNTPVYWARNCVNVARSMTQHGEVRLITGYLQNSTETSLRNNYTLYTTLEPCAMCAGMMMLTSLPRCVWGQKDTLYGDALERLELNSTELNSIGSHQRGYGPYPRYVQSDGSTSKYRFWLDSNYSEYQAQAQANNTTSHITQFLATTQAEQIFSSAYQAFMDYQAEFSENNETVEVAHRFIRTVSGNYSDAESGEVLEMMDTAIFLGPPLSCEGATSS